MNYLPEARFRCLTITIVSVALITGILIPNIEFVLGLVGSTIGVMICLIFPAIFFISISSKHTNERLLAQAILFIGICIMILGTYANLYAMEESTITKALVTTNKPLSQINNLPLSLNKDEVRIIANARNNPELLPNIKEKIGELPDINILDKTLDVKVKDMRQEPPIPVERVVVTEKQVETQKSVESIVATFSPEIKKIVEKIKTLDEDLKKESRDAPKLDSEKAIESITLKAEEKINMIEQKERSADMQDTQKNDNLINSDAIRKEESELAADVEAANIIAAERREELRKTLEKHKLEQLQMMREQKEILKDIKEQKQEIEREKKRMEQDAQEQKKNEKLENLKEPEKSRNIDNKQLTNEVEVENDKKTRNGNAEVQQAKLDGKIEKQDDNKQPNDQAFEGKKELENIPKRDNAPNEDNIKNGAVIDSVPVKDRVIVNALNNSRISEVKIEKSAGTLINPEELQKGPILNVLTKRTSQKSSAVDDTNKDDNNRGAVRENNEILDNAIPTSPDKTNSKTDDRKIQHKYSLPIALKMRNQTKTENASYKNDENVQAIRRDILENHEREKRDVDIDTDTRINTKIDTKVTNDVSGEKVESLAKNFTDRQDRENCLKQEKEINRNSTNKSKEESEHGQSEIGSAEASLIKTNIYLSEQEIANAISVDPNIPMRGEYVKVKQRDLKAVDTNGNGDR